MKSMKNEWLFIETYWLRQFGSFQSTEKRMIKITKWIKLILQTYDSDKQVPDSASTATAVFCGVKTNYGVSGVDANVQRGNCEASLNQDNHLSSILSWAQEAGKDTGNTEGFLSLTTLEFCQLNLPHATICSTINWMYSESRIRDDHQNHSCNTISSVRSHSWPKMGMRECDASECRKV